MLCILSDSFRKVCFKVVTSHTFSTISFAMILLSSVVLMLEFPNGLNSDDSELCTVQQIIIWVDIGLLAFFVFEMLLKVLKSACLYVCAQGAYVSMFVRVCTLKPHTITNQRGYCHTHLPRLLSPPLLCR